MKKVARKEETLNFDPKQLISDGDCFGTYEGTNIACIDCHDSHACAYLKQHNAISASRNPATNMGAEGIFKEIEDWLPEMKSGVDIMTLAKRANGHLTHLTLEIVCIKLKALSLANGIQIRAGKFV